MNPIKFKGHNKVFGEDQDEYLDLPVFQNDSPQGEVVQCWRLGPEEIKKVVETGEIWVMQMTFNQPLQPILISVDSLIHLKEIENEDPKPNAGKIRSINKG